MSDAGMKRLGDGPIEAASDAADVGSDAAANAGDTAAVAEEILRRRAAEYARVPVDSESAAAAVEVLVVGVGAERFGVPVKRIAELLKDVVVTPVPGGPAALAGFVNLRGDVLPVFDLGEVLGVMRGAETTSSSKRGGPTRLPWVVVVDDASDEFGLTVQAVEGVRSVPLEEIESVSVETSGDALVVGVTSDAVSVLDGEQLLRDARLFVDQGEA